MPAGKSTAQAHNHMVTYGLLVRTADSEQRYCDAAVDIPRRQRIDALLQPLALCREKAVPLRLLRVPGNGRLKADCS